MIRIRLMKISNPNKTITNTNKFGPAGCSVFREGINTLYYTGQFLSIVLFICVSVVYLYFAIT